ncbi:hypothetical protein CoNPh35_CDS0053 [Staphylococcus phage S-CoN_Ph35]|nr:hypothetical protein CoNPh35_CDS0053 [Staphylococcus phage S-CoN_Ph35]
MIIKRILKLYPILIIINFVLMYQMLKMVHYF